MAQLSLAYIRRKKWEARILAVAVVSALGESMNGDNGQKVALSEFERVSGARG